MTALTADQAYRKAFECYAAGQLQQAEEICRAVLKVEPRHADSSYLLAVICSRQGRHDESDQLLRRAVESNAFSITLDCPAPTAARHEQHPHVGLHTLLEQDLARYRQTLQSFEDLLPWLQKIPAEPTDDSPHWNNLWIPPLDGIALYCLVALKRPARYVEVGSGNSTKFVRRAIRDHRLDTEIISIDPEPRAEIDALCDVAIRKPLEGTDLSVFAALDMGDVVFADNSHRCFMNSDVTVFFTEVLPALAHGVTVGIHDIFLPYGYPGKWVGRYYSEQYLLACYLLARGPLLRVILPMHFMLRHAAGRDAAQAFCARLPGAPQPDGASFWLELI